ncbi:hypothetical protein [Alkaliphilus metalliredigens]|nr:hypothetical protein [Alkaliphilus metalliredigens]
MEASLLFDESSANGSINNRSSCIINYIANNISLSIRIEISGLT